MASFFCHGFGVAKQVRLERIVRPLLQLPVGVGSVWMPTDTGPPNRAT